MSQAMDYIFPRMAAVRSASWTLCSIWHEGEEARENVAGWRRSLRKSRTEEDTRMMEFTDFFAHGAGVSKCQKVER
jgi:hypothetical protein